VIPPSGQDRAEQSLQEAGQEEARQRPSRSGSHAGRTNALLEGRGTHRFRLYRGSQNWPKNVEIGRKIIEIGRENAPAPLESMT
jgi:hypothetical protein